MSELRMPSLGADMDAGTLIEWHVAPGARVTRGQVVALVETQKGIIEVEIWEAGVIDTILVTPGTKVPVGTVLATVRADGAPPVVAAAPPPPPPAPPAPSSLRASPAARQLARERGLDLAGVKGTGPHGVVTRADVEHASAPPPPPPPPPPVAPAKPVAFEAAAMRKAIGAAMARAKREIPHYYLSTEIDVTAATRWLEEVNARRPVTERILFAAVVLKAVAAALREVPELNGFFVDGEVRPGAGIHVGPAIALRGGGLVAPAIHDTDKLSVAETMAHLSDLVARAKAGKLRSSEMTDATITVTNLGDQGVDCVIGVIYPPQVALVGFGRVRERPWAEGGMLGIRSVVEASLAADHRASDGHRGARFLAALTQKLMHPEEL